MSYTLRGRLESRLAALVPVVVAAGVLALAQHRWWPIEAVALMLGAVGLYGVVAYGVSVRRREIGVRIALGARPADVSRTVSLDGLRLAAVGVAIGMACAIAFTRLLRGLLYDVPPYDPLALGVTMLALVGCAAVALLVPVRRAMRSDATAALR